MNERIRELWAQCVNKHAKTPINWQNAADEFAETIISQCVFELIHESTKQSSTEIQDFSVIISNRIKQHFGIG
jgi:hypothetical protein